MLSIKVILFLNQIFAMPVERSTCTNFQINNPGGKYEYLFNESCDRIYLMPPEQGRIEFSQPFTHTTVNECRFINERRKLFTDEMIEISNLARNISSAANDTSHRTGNIEQFRDRLVSLQSLKFQSIKDLNLLERRLHDLKNKEQQILTTIDDCRENNTRYCTYTKYDHESIQNRIRTLDNQIQAMDFRIFRINNEIDYVQKEINFRNQHANSDRVNAIQRDLDDKVLSLQRKYNEFIKSYNTVPGAKYNFSLFNNTSQHLESFLSNNPSLRGHTQILPIKSGLISFYSVVGGERLSFPLIMESNIVGTSLVPSTHTTNNDLELNIESEVELSTESIQALLMGRSISGYVILNSIGTCSLVNNNEFDNSKMDSVVTATYTYSYDVEVFRKYEIKRSMKYLHEIVRSQSKSKRGLFRTSTLSSLTQKQIGESYLQLVISNNDSDFDWEDREKLATELRQDMMDEFVNTYGDGFFKTDKLPDLIDNDPSAASAAANTLSSCKHKYCQYAVIGLNLGDSLFGGNRSASYFRNELKDERSEFFNDKKAMKRYNTMSFKLEVK